MIRRIVQFVAGRYKGAGFSIGEEFSVLDLLGYSVRRVVSLLRCIFLGVVVSLDPRKLVFVEEGVRVYGRKYIRFGSGVTLGRNVMIYGLSREGVSIGDGVNIGPYSIIQASGSLREVGRGLRIGNNSGCGAYSFFGASGGVFIGDDVIMGQRVSFHSSNHIFDDLSLPIRKQGVTKKGIRIGNDCWVGANCVFLDGASVGSGCVIAAGSVVRGEFPPRSVIAGVPAKVIKNRG